MAKTIHTPKPLYRNLKFSTEAKFQEWLDNTATRRIDFMDHGQDLTAIWIDDKGEILHANLQTSIWCGKMVDPEAVTLGVPIRIWDDAKKDYYEYIRLYIDDITDLK